MQPRFAQKYFDIPEVWDPALWRMRIADQERAKLASQWLPPQVTSILDVGCGNGVFTDQIEASRFKVGLDLSMAALVNIKAPRLRANAAILPFSDNAFDATVSMEMLEHLPQSIYKIALDELLRVSRSYALITVPFNEKLAYNQVICPVCRCKFHPYHHVRAYFRDVFQDLFGSQSRLVRLNSVIPVKRKAFPALWNLIRLYTHREGREFPFGALCPQCGYTPKNNANIGNNIIRPHSLRRSLGRLWPQYTTFTWWMALYEKTT